MLLALAVVGCSRSERVAAPAAARIDETPPPAVEDSAREQLAIRAKGLAEVKAEMALASKVVECRVVSAFNKDYQQAKTKPRYKGYALLAQREVPADQVAQLIAILAAPEGYEPPGHESTCLPDPGYILSFERTGHSVEIVVCFTCGDVWIHGVPGLKAVTLPMTAETSRVLWKHVEKHLARGSA